jgi:hypothetical protein
MSTISSSTINIQEVSSGSIPNPLLLTFLMLRNWDKEEQND